jgi:hypothetical protein
MTMVLLEAIAMLRYAWYKRKSIYETMIQEQKKQESDK